MKTYLILLIALVGLNKFSPYSTRHVSGYVYNADDKKPLPGATVLVAGTNILTHTDIKGHYRISVLVGKTSLVFSDTTIETNKQISYKTQTLSIGKSNVLNSYLAIAMQYLIDTSEYKVSAFKRGKNQTLGDLLKNIPDFKIDTDGSIMHRGKQVTKAQLSGKNFGNIELKNAITILPGDIFEKIQVIDDYGDAALNSFKDPQPIKVLNLVTKKGYDNIARTYLKKNKPAVVTDQVAAKSVRPDTSMFLRKAIVPQNSQVKDLLKNMQGFQVDANGSVTHQGQAVTKARLNGREYAGGNLQQAIQNLPADIVEKIQVMDDYGDQASMTGVKSGEPNKTLNFIPRAQADESYSRIVENQFQSAKATPLSTFSADVDAASYSNLRRFINSGQLPPKNAVRIEEMINYFHYDLPEPEGDKPVAIQTELSAAPWNPQHQLVRIGLKAKNVQKDKLPPSNLVFLIDVSGSMDEPNKLPLVKASMKMLVDQLRAVDHVAIVVYAGEAGLKLASTPGSDKQKIKDAIDLLSAGGSTAGGAGIMLAYNVAAQDFIKGGNNRIILATDGDFNVGASSDKSMEQLIEEERNTGVNLSILGFGMGNLKDSKMERMADKGRGNYAYIDNITEATKSMVSEFGGTLFTVAKDVKLQVEFNPAKVQAYRLLGYEDRLMAKEDFNNDTKVGGDMGVGHTVTALYELIPAGVKDSFTASVDPLKYQKTEEGKSTNASNEVMTVKFRYKKPDGDVSKMEAVTVKDQPESAAKTSADFRFAAAVAEYGLLLRNSQFKQQASFEQLIALAKGAKGADDNGYRAEFIRMAESTRNLTISLAAGKN